ncbi:hypothetical protein BC477_10615 [Clavibacter michiganensis subsp. michiganensis]|uniref:Uncharacterized protein n=1 Tax=Clavibacter michiganensis subsp. michiganensis TaxID=33013 RepID=A0A251XQ42_CLAMM|nr:hypothetical protein BC477_10615 [Clavibacter michiganensis subsp. michiganensis]OUE05178.1 hypothetical protein CMMCAS07_09535 [Clavibacter michiganensis subsp. michiganensis]
MAGMTAMMRVLPFVTVVFAGIAPLAAALYLLSSAAWTLLERAALRRVLAARHPGDGRRMIQPAVPPHPVCEDRGTPSREPP